LRMRRPMFVADGDVLQIGIRRRKASRGRHGLVERGVDAPRRAVDQLGQRLDIGRKQFLHAPVFEDQIVDPVFAGELTGGSPRRCRTAWLGHLGLLGNAHFPEKHLAPARRAELMFRFVAACAIATSSSASCVYSTANTRPRRLRSVRTTVRTDRPARLRP